MLAARLTSRIPVVHEMVKIFDAERTGSEYQNQQGRNASKLADEVDPTSFRLVEPPDWLLSPWSWSRSNVSKMLRLPYKSNKLFAEYHASRVAF